MPGIKTAIALQDKMSNVFKAITTAANSAKNSLKNVSDQVKNTDNSMKKASSSSNSFFKSLTQFEVAKKAFTMITNQLDSAINRFDTLNNYKNVMAGLGFDSSQSEASINRLKERLEGLPTTLDDAVLSVQRFSAVNENLGVSTEIVLALNDALAAGGTPAQTQAAALEQISQAYAKGKFDAMEYKAMMNAMPAQLKQVAKAMGYTSTALGGDFYNALQQGKLGMNDMMKTMVELDQQTGGFHDQALKATNGIKTAFTNMKTAITKGLTDIIDNINKGLEEMGLPNIQTMITNTGKTIKNVLSTIGKVAARIMQSLKPLLNWFKNLYNQAKQFLTPVIDFFNNIGQTIQQNWAIIEPIIQAVAIALLAYYGYTLLAAAGTAILNGAMALLQSTTFWIILALVAVIAILIYFWNTNDEVAEAIIYMWDMLKLGAKALKLGVQIAFHAIVIAALTLYNGFLVVKAGLVTAFHLVKIGAITMQLGFEGACQAIVNAFVWMYGVCKKGLVNLGGSMQDLDYADFTSNTIETLGHALNDLATSAAEQRKTVEGVNKQISDEKTAMYNDIVDSGIIEEAIEMGKTRKKRVSERTKFSTNLAGIDTSTIQTAINEADWSQMANNIDSVTGASGSGSNGGGKALKTTSTDKNLLSDDDIQLLLDVATRDYKLNYQQITPNITITFGDVRETADVDDILDKVSDKLEEIYDGNLEVATNVG